MLYSSVLYKTTQRPTYIHTLTRVINHQRSIYTETGKCVNVYKRLRDGTWKNHIAILTSDNPPSEQSHSVGQSTHVTSGWERARESVLGR